MCRLAVYIGASIRLEDLILKPAHNLVEQAYAPREMQEARLNADGYGFGWFDDDGTPAVYTNTMPIWADHNLETLGRRLQATQ
jgi:glutamine amidotransferase